MLEAFPLSISQQGELIRRATQLLLSKRGRYFTFEGRSVEKVRNHRGAGRRQRIYETQAISDTIDLGSGHYSKEVISVRREGGKTGRTFKSEVKGLDLEGGRWMLSMRHPEGTIIWKNFLRWPSALYAGTI